MVSRHRTWLPCDQNAPVYRWARGREQEVLLIKGVDKTISEPLGRACRSVSVEFGDIRSSCLEVSFFERPLREGGREGGLFTIEIAEEDRPRRSRANRPLSSGRTLSPINVACRGGGGAAGEDVNQRSQEDGATPRTYHQRWHAMPVTNSNKRDICRQ